jgi:phospholipid/cholesterol/gamma-HCH transport system substrate-binding protein
MTNKNILVGIFVLAGVVLFTVGLFLIGSRHNAFDRHMEFYTEFSNLSGLAKGAKVRVAGMEAGQVTEIQIPTSPASRFRVKMQVESKLRGLVRTDSLVSIETEGVVGDTFLLIKSGTPQAPSAANSSTLPSKEPLDLSALLDKGNGLMTDATKTIKDADKTIQQLGTDIHTTLGTTNTTIANVDDVVTGIKQGRGAVGLLLRDQQFAGEVRETLDKANQATGSLAHASGQADQMVSNLQARNLPQKIDDTMNSAKSAAAQLDSTAKQLNQTITEATGPDSSGETAGANLRDSLSNAKAATANLADDTESLKHEFFFKGFFKKRGYYQLTELKPAAYRQDKVFNSAANHRIWLASSELFDAKPDGSEVLSTRGKAALDSAIAQDGGPAIDQPIVVEGYSNAPALAEQLAASRQRAILVSQFLQKRFQLDPRNVGFIALTNHPPSAAGHADYDGICINILFPKK